MASIQKRETWEVIDSVFPTRKGALAEASRLQEVHGEVRVVIARSSWQVRIRTASSFRPR